MLSAEIQQKWERIDVQGSADDDGQKAAADEGRIKVMFGKRKYGYTNVRENEIFGHEVEQVEKLFGYGPKKVFEYLKF